MFTKIKAILFLLLISQCSSYDFFITHESDGAITYKTSPNNINHVAKAYFSNSVNETGWGIFEVETVKTEDDLLQSYAAGILEGVATRDFIWMYWQNTMKDLCEGKGAICAKVYKYVKSNLKWMSKMIKKYSNTDSYWYQVKLYMKQIEGLTVGYNNATKNKDERLSFFDMLSINLQGDFEDLFQKFDDNRMKGNGRCSALVKLLPDGSDLYVSHDTWNSYQSMLRILKKYTLNVKKLHNSDETIIGSSMSFSSYPAQLQSGDDFYVISSGLTTLETTIGNSNPNLWQYCEPVGQVMEFVRSIVANRLADSGEAWCNIFKQYNSGTYNNQWMVVDYKKFKPKKSNKKSGLLWVIEQVPGNVEMQDMTDFLTSNLYWPSYNVPYFTNIFNISGGPEQVKKHGDWFTYDKTPRALIFKRDHMKIQNMDDMYKMMRYNDFKHDPLSKCECQPPYSAENSIAARNDLNPANGTYPFSALGHRSHGATDTKITNSELAKTLQFWAESGPTYDQAKGIPPFKWSETDFGETTPHVGHPDEWTFKPIVYKWSTN